MTRPSSTLLALCIALLLSGCGASRTATVPSKHVVTPPASVTPFSVPSGWMNFSADSTRNTLLWLVKKDYAAEIVVENIFNAPKATDRSEEAGEVEAIARAIFMIDKGKNTTVIEEPKKSESGGQILWHYLMQNTSGDRLRVVVGQTVKYGLVRCAASVRQADDLRDAAKVQDSLLEGPVQ